MEISLFSGWALTPDDTFAALTQEFRCIRGGAHDALRAADFGFWSAPSTFEQVAPDLLSERKTDAKRVAICHSLGFLWLLCQAPHSWDALVVLGGFPRFSQADDFPWGVSPRILRRMKDKLALSSDAMLLDFRTSCALPQADRLPGTPQLERLQEGLGWLQSWDGREAWKKISCPTLVLAAPDDAIVSPELVRACFSEVVWSDGGGHALPATRAAWCAQHIVEFIRNKGLAD